MAASRASSLTAPAFSSGEVALAVALALAVELGLFVLIAIAGQSGLQIANKDAAPPEPVPMKVLPVLDDAPLLKLGGKKVKTKLPEMWKKNPPVQRFEEKSAPSPMADKNPETLPTSKLAEKDAEAPPPDAEVAKEVDQELLDAGPDAAPTVEGEGAADGVKEGTETDPLKARAVSQYFGKLQGWFNARFSQPTEIPCEELKKLRSSVSVSVSGDRAVAGSSVVRPSGNAVFDERVRATLDRIRGEQLPPPPPLYPDILGSTLPPVTFQGRCD
ncbi:MAG TPA: TonB C-terminal domain-containing protein [Polyangiaceae bacterium]|jgi:hypothetical protein|nr:TonB C-terminal domain-containing protein [Polyangiaceae bacterium]